MSIIGLTHATEKTTYRVIKFDNDTVQIKDICDNCVEIANFEGDVYITITNKNNHLNIENVVASISRFYYDISIILFKNDKDKVDKIEKIISFINTIKTTLVDTITIELNI